MNKKPFGRRINNWLAEPKGEIFRDGKWRFWFPTLLGLTALNAVMTAMIFGQDGAQKYIGSIVVLAGAVLCWLALGLLHYSDSEDRLLAIGVAVFDSVTLLFVAAHFSFLLWCQGHLWTLRAAGEKYRQDMATYNAHWPRRNKVSGSGSEIKFQASLTPMEIPPPPKELAEASAAFLSKWDSWIRLTGFGELGLSIVTLIFVRTRTAARNRIAPLEDEFPDELGVENRVPMKREKFSPKKDITKTYMSFNSEGLKRLRGALRDISFRLHKLSFKVDVQDDVVWIRMMKANQGTQETVSSAKAKLSILEDVIQIPREAFRERLENFLRENDFEI